MNEATRFAAEWLAVRQPADSAARDQRLLAGACAYLSAVADPVAVDLGAGTGATVAAFASGTPPARWRLVDQDAGLLAMASSRFGRGVVQPFCGDLAEVANLPLAEARLVTASALLDLMTEGWVGALAERLAEAGIGFYAALTYDGQMAWDPPLVGDAAVVAGFNRHQRGDKGQGPVLGPAAAATMANALADRRYDVQFAASPWRLGAKEAALQRRLVAGIADALHEPAWGQARCAAAASTVCTVGHLDLLALPGTSAQSKTTSFPRP